MTYLENRIPPPLLFMATAVGMWLASRHSTQFVLPGDWSPILIVLLAGFGLVLGGPAIRAFRSAGTTINPVDIAKASMLVTSGVFRISRNPMYVSLSVLLAAWALQLGTIWAVAGAVVFVAFINRFQIVPEERFLASRFGEAYLEYRSEVRRWL